MGGGHGARRCSLYVGVAGAAKVNERTLRQFMQDLFIVKVGSEKSSVCV